MSRCVTAQVSVNSHIHVIKTSQFRFYWSRLSIKANYLGFPKGDPKVKNALRNFFPSVTNRRLGPKTHAYLPKLGVGLYDLQGFIQYYMQSLGSFRHVPRSEKFCQVSSLVCEQLEQE